MLVIGVAMLAGAVLALAFSLGVIGGTDRAVRARLTASKPADQVAVKRMKQLDQLEGTERKVMSARMFRRLERNLVLAGHPAGWTMRNVALVKVSAPVVLGLMSSKFLIFSGNPVLTIMGIAAVVVGYFLPDLLVHSRATERQDEITRALPDVLDKIVIAIEAGLGFESAMATTAHAGKGPLADELVRTVQDIQLGVSRRSAYEALQRRTSSDDLTSFIRGVIQAEEHGSSMSSMVRIQSQEMRMKRKLRAEAKAGKVSVKMLGPLMACIFPVLFIIVLAPGIINAFGMF